MSGRWKPGTFRTDALEARVRELAQWLQRLADEHRLNNGCLPWNVEVEDFAQALDEYMRLQQNMASAYRTQGRLLDEANAWRAAAEAAT